MKQYFKTPRIAKQRIIYSRQITASQQLKAVGAVAHKITQNAVLFTPKQCQLNTS
jgi:hypothetical protein